MFWGGRVDLNAVMDRLKSKSDLLSPQLRIAARHMVANPEDVALNSMRALAIEAGVKPPTMVRLAQALGFTSYDDLRLPFQEWIRYRDKSFTAQARDMQARTHEETRPARSGRTYQIVRRKLKHRNGDPRFRYEHRRPVFPQEFRKKHCCKSYGIAS